MPVHVNINAAQVQAKLMDAWERGRGQLSEEILNDMNQYCKEDTGTLIASSQIHSTPKEGRLVWRTPYARRQYYEIRTAHKDVNPQATWKWCEVARQHHREEWRRKAQRIVEMLK